MRLAGLSVAILASSALLFGCNGNYSGTAPGSDPAGAGNIQTSQTSFDSDRDFFQARVKPRMDFCRSCHVPNGVADTDDGHDFMLSDDSSQDYENFKASWKKLKLDKTITDDHPFLAYQSGIEDHSGGKNWPEDSPAYADVLTLVTCWAGGDCDFSSDGGAVDVDQWPLLGSLHAQSRWARFCKDKPDTAELPTDPRTLIQPDKLAQLGQNDKAVYYNAYWQDCHVNLTEADDWQHPTTCGEFRHDSKRGLHFMMDVLPTKSQSAAEYNQTWKKWGLDARPDNFDQMYTLRYGLNPGPYHNPYPLPGEDPNETNGGSGRLPMGLRQLKDEDGNWTGQLGTSSCFACHGGELGDPYAGEPDYMGMRNIGVGNNNYDVSMNARDDSALVNTPLEPFASVLLLDFNTIENMGVTQRGLNNAVGAFELLITILDYDTLNLNPNPLKTITPNGLQGILDIAHPLAHTQNTPAWWNLSFRPRKFFDAGLSEDSARIVMAAGDTGSIFSGDGAGYRHTIETWSDDVNTWFLTLRSPDWPWGFCSGPDGAPGPGDDQRCINKELAKQGAILFHNKDLWAQDGNKDKPKPPLAHQGNGSCASCHGVYSPRYAHNKQFLATPVLEGVAGHIVPLDIIGTDPARSDMLTKTLRRGWDTTYWAYPDHTPGWVPPDQKNPVLDVLDDMYPFDQRPTGVCGWEKDVIGYQAPPLYGVWATAPYFHNGSVPTLAGVLDSARRPQLWRRKLQTIGPVTGYDQRISKAFDTTHVGWKYDTLTCDQIPGLQATNCNPLDKSGPSLTQLVQNLLNSTVDWAGLVPLPNLTPDAMDKRFVYDTRKLGNSNEGHDFTDVLTEQERKAVIEYLKTL